MAREFSVRISEELARWVRRQGPTKRVVGSLAMTAYRGAIRADIEDPGPGPERLTVRIPERALPRLRTLTRSRNNLVAIRKLLSAGYESGALPAPPQELALPVPARSLDVVLEERPIKCPSTSRQSIERLVNSFAVPPISNPAYRQAMGLQAKSPRREWTRLLFVLLGFVALIVLLFGQSKKPGSAPVKRNPPGNPWVPLTTPSDLADAVG